MPSRAVGHQEHTTADAFAGSVQSATKLKRLDFSDDCGSVTRPSFAKAIQALKAWAMRLRQQIGASCATATPVARGPRS